MTLNDIIDDTLSDKPSNLPKKRLNTGNNQILALNDPSFSDLPTKSSLTRKSDKKNNRILDKLGHFGVKNSKWSPAEVDQFFEGLTVFGTDFTMIRALVLPTKSRNQIMKLFAKKDVENQAKIDAALLWNRLSYRKNRWKIDQQIADTIDSCNLSVE